MKKFFLWTAVAVAAVMLVIGLCFGKVIEESLFGEIAKWVVVSVGVIGIFEVFAFTIGQIVYDFWYVRKKSKEGKEDED